MLTFRVVNFDTGEIVAELHDYDLAVKMAERMAADGGYKELWGVIELVTRYTTARGSTDQP